MSDKELNEHEKEHAAACAQRANAEIRGALELGRTKGYIVCACGQPKRWQREGNCAVVLDHRGKPELHMPIVVEGNETWN